MDKYAVTRKHSSDQNESEIGRFRYRHHAQDFIKHQIASVVDGFKATPYQVCVWKEGGHKTDWQVNVYGSAPFKIRFTIEIATLGNDRRI